MAKLTITRVTGGTAPTVVSRLTVRGLSGSGTLPASLYSRLTIQRVTGSGTRPVAVAVTGPTGVLTSGEQASIRVLGTDGTPMDTVKVTQQAGLTVSLMELEGAYYFTTPYDPAGRALVFSVIATRGGVSSSGSVTVTIAKHPWFLHDGTTWRPARAYVHDGAKWQAAKPATP